MIIIYDAQRQMLANNILLYILYMVCIKRKHSNTINNVRKKENLHLLLFITKIKLITIIPTKVQLGTS